MRRIREVQKSGRSLHTCIYVLRNTFVTSDWLTGGRSTGDQIHLEWMRDTERERERESTRQNVLSQSSVKLSGFHAVEFVFIAYFSRSQSESLTVVFVSRTPERRAAFRSQRERLVGPVQLRHVGRHGDAGFFMCW